MFHVFRLSYVRSDQPGQKRLVGYFADKPGAESAVTQFIARLRAAGGVSTVHKLDSDHYRAVHPDADKFIDLLVEVIAVTESQELLSPKTQRGRDPPP